MLSQAPASADPTVNDSHDVLRRRIWVLAFSCAAFCYLCLLFSPLRLVFDSVVLLSIAESASLGRGFLDNGAATVYPPGYPALVALLLKMKMAHPASLIALNLAGLFSGLAACAYILRKVFMRSRAGTLAVIALFLLSFTIFKHASLAMTDIPFFGISLLCVAVIVAGAENTGRRFTFCLIGAILLAILALAIRRTGLALLPPVFFMVFANRTVREHLLARKSVIVTAVALLLLAAGSAAIVKGSFTLSDFAVVARGKSVWQLELETIRYRCLEMGQLILNLPSGQVPKLPDTVFFLCGLIAISLVVAGMIRQTRLGVVEVYVWSYLGILSLWPYYDPRFWIPVLPLMLVYGQQAFQTWKQKRLLVVTGILYEAVFCALGFATLAVGTSISLSGQAFSSRYANGNERATYCAAWQNCPGGYDRDKIFQKDLHILKVYR